MRVKDENFICIQGWMRTELDLKGNDLLVYAIIYGFSQTENQRFTGSVQYLADWCGASRQGIMKNLNNLVASGLLKKEVNIINGVNSVSYYATKLNEGVNSVDTPLTTQLTPPDNSVDTPCKLSLHNNIDNKINNNIESIIYKKPAGPATPENPPEDISDFNSHAYTEETPKERYRRLKAEKKKSDYESHAYTETRLTTKDKCKEYIDKFTNDPELRNVLYDYLNVRVAIDDKPLSYKNWQSLLSKLNNMDGDKIEIVKQSIKENWASFYPLGKGKTTKTEAWDKNVKSEAMTQEDYERQKAFLEEKRKNGERTVF